MEEHAVKLWDTARASLLAWAPSHGRSFSWRVTVDPFVILVAEMLLKRTTAPVVERFLPTFLKAYPSPSALAQAALEEVEHILEPIGLMRQRGAQLKAVGTALVSQHGGKVPAGKEDLVRLPGIGEYAANAVLCFAYGEPEALVDTNVARVITRIGGISPSRYEARRSPEVWEAARAVVGDDGGTAREVNWALLDLGASVCLPRHPRCPECPLRSLCCYALSRAERATREAAT